MPIEQGYEMRDGKRWGWYRWKSGEKYYYTPGNEQARKAAKTKAENQREAAHASGYDG
jgi:hypothetical protein